MPFQYARDDAKRRVTLILSDPLTVAERIAAVVSAMHNALCVESPVQVFWDMDEARMFLERLDPS